MTTAIMDAPRLFRIGSLALPDPDPSLPPEEAVQLYSGNFPQVVGATLSEPELNADGALEFTVERAPAKTKG